jgi:hypothetical protein
VQRLSGFYIALEEYFMVRNVRKAINIDQHIGDTESGNKLSECSVPLPSFLFF